MTSDGSAAAAAAAAAAEASSPNPINVRDHGTLLDSKKNRVQCNYCSKLMTGFYRLKFHLAGVPKDVSCCDKVPENVRNPLYSLIPQYHHHHQSPNKTDSLASGLGGRTGAGVQLRKRSISSSSPSLTSSNNAAADSVVKHLKCDPAPSKSNASGSTENDAEMTDSAAHDHHHRLPPSRYSIGRKAANNAEAKKDPSAQAQGNIARFFYETGIDFSAANSPSFKLMINSTLLLGKGGLRKFKVPTSLDLKGPMLQDAVREMHEHVNKIRCSWAATGCSILLDGWVDEKGRNLVSFLVDCPEGPIYLRSDDVSGIVEDVDALQSLLDEVIEEVGTENVVQIIAASSTGWMGEVGKNFRQRRRTVFWTLSASRCIELMLEKISAMDSVEGVLDKARVLTNFIYGHGEVLKLMRNYTEANDLIQPSPSRRKLAAASASFLTLENIVSEKTHLQHMIASSEWRTSAWASTSEGQRVAHLVEDISFWNEAEMFSKATMPLLRVMSLISEADTPQLGYIYETMDQAKETIKEQLKNKKSLYGRFWQVIDDIWDSLLHSPLHAAGHYLNPSLFYATDFHSDPEVNYGLLCCIVRMVSDQRTQDLISLQLDEYRHGRGAFEEGSDPVKIATISPALWWRKYAKQYPELQSFAIRILSQNCEGAGRYGLKRGPAEKLLVAGRDHIEQEQQLSDLASVHYNLHLKNNIVNSGSDHLVAAAAGEI